MQLSLINVIRFLDFLAQRWILTTQLPSPILYYENSFECVLFQNVCINIPPTFQSFANKSYAIDARVGQPW